MNRIPVWFGQKEKSFTSVNDVQQALFRSSENGGFIHSSFIPLHYEPNYAYPLLIWLHGPRNNELQLRRVMPLVSMRNYVAVAPRGPQRDSPDDAPTATYSWGQSIGFIHEAEQRVESCIALASRRFNVARQRVFLAGYGCGGTMALRVALRNPGDFLGVVSVGGAFPTGNTPLSQLAAARHLPVLLAHGRDSEAYTEDRVCDDLRLLHTAGMSVTLRQYPCGDDLTTKMLSDVDVWVMDRVTGGSMDSDSDDWNPYSQLDQLN